MTPAAVLKAVACPSWRLTIARDAHYSSSVTSTTVRHGHAALLLLVLLTEADTAHHSRLLLVDAEVRIP